MLHFEHKLTSTGSREKDLSAAEVLGKIHDLKKPKKPEEADPEFVRLALDLVTDLSAIYKGEAKKELREFEVKIDPKLKFNSVIGSGDQSYYVFEEDREDSTIPLAYLYDSSGKLMEGDFRFEFKFNKGSEKVGQHLFFGKVEDRLNNQTVVYSAYNNCRIVFPGSDVLEDPHSIVSEQFEGFKQVQGDMMVVVGKNGTRLDIPFGNSPKMRIENILCVGDEVIVQYKELNHNNKEIAQKIVTSSGVQYGGEGQDIVKIWEKDDKWQGLLVRKEGMKRKYVLVDKNGEKTIKTTSAFLVGGTMEKSLDVIKYQRALAYNPSEYYNLNGDLMDEKGDYTNVIVMNEKNRTFHVFLNGGIYSAYTEEGIKIGDNFNEWKKGFDGKVYFTKKNDQGGLEVYDETGKQIGGPFESGDKIESAGMVCGKFYITLNKGGQKKLVDNLGNNVNIPVPLRTFEIEGRAYFLSGNIIYNERGLESVILVGAAKVVFNSGVQLVPGNVKLFKPNKYDLAAMYKLSDGSEMYSIDYSDNRRLLLKNATFVDAGEKKYFIGVPENPSLGRNTIEVYNSDLENTNHNFEEIVNTEVVSGDLYVTGMRDGVLVREKID